MPTPDPTSSSLIAQISFCLSDLYSPEDAALWLRSEQRLLGGARPIDLFDTEEGLQRVLAVVRRAMDATFI